MKICCPNCGFPDIAKKGFRYNHLGKKQKYRCIGCMVWFVEDDGFKRMRHPPEQIVRAIHMHNDGMSLFKTQNHLWQHDAVKVTRKTISDWTKKYADFLKSAARKRTAKTQRKAAFG